MKELIKQEALINLITDQAKKFEIQNASKIRFKVGRLTNITEKMLVDFFLMAVNRKNLKPQLQFEIEWVPARLKCNSCQAIVENGYVCGQCSSEDLKIISGEEFFIDDVVY